jgi:hypothetical protein
MDLIIAAANDIVAALKHPSAGSPLSPLTDSQANALRNLAQLLTNKPNETPTQTAPCVSSEGAELTKATPSASSEGADHQLATPPLQPPPGFTQPAAPTAPTVTAAPTLDNKPTPPVDENTPPTTGATYHGNAGRRARGKPRRSQRTPKPKAYRAQSRHNNQAFAAQELLQATTVQLQALDGPETVIPHGFAYTAIHPDTGESVEYDALLRSSAGQAWERGCADEFGRLAQGNTDNPSINGTNTFFFIRHNQVPTGVIPTYCKIVVADKPNKEIQQRVRLTVGGDRIDYPGDKSTKTADLTTAKCLLNSVVSTPKALYGVMDIKDFYLGTPMGTYAYMRIAIKHVPDTIMKQYNLYDKVYKGYLYVEIRKGMYGLPQAGKIANDRLVAHLLLHGYTQADHTHGLFTHKTRKGLMFSLVVDDFGVQYIRREDAEHLATTLRLLYEISIDWTGTKYLGLTLAWDYNARTCDISMPGYIARTLQRFKVGAQTRAQHSPHAWMKPQYGAKIQYSTPTDESAALPASDRQRLQEIIGTLLYYGRAIDSSLLVALGTLSAAQTKGTHATALACTQLLNYCATHPNTTIRFHASDMILDAHSDASYLSEAKARSRVGGYHHLSSAPRHAGEIPHPDDTPPRLNGAVLVVSNIMPQVLASAAEAEIAGLFYNGQEAATIRTILTEMGYPQPPTRIQTDNVTAAGIANSTVKQRRSKAIDMRFYWIRDRVRQGQFIIHWKSGATNRADYFTKHHAPSHHRVMRKTYYHEPSTTTASKIKVPTTNP